VVVVNSEVSVKNSLLMGDRGKGRILTKGIEGDPIEGITTRSSGQTTGRTAGRGRSWSESILLAKRERPAKTGRR